MSKKPDLKTIFGKFTGQPLKDPGRLSCDMDEVLESMRAAAKKNGLELCVRFPGGRGDCSAQENRVNVAVSQDADGKLRVAGKFSLG